MYPFCSCTISHSTLVNHPTPSVSTTTTKNQTSIYTAISACMYFVGDSGAKFDRSGYKPIILRKSKYRAHLSRLGTIYLDESQNFIHIVPHYLEVYEVKSGG